MPENLFGYKKAQIYPETTRRILLLFSPACSHHIIYTHTIKPTSKIVFAIFTIL